VSKHFSYLPHYPDCCCCCCSITKSRRSDGDMVASSDSMNSNEAIISCIPCELKLIGTNWFLLTLNQCHLCPRAFRRSNTNLLNDVTVSEAVKRDDKCALVLKSKPPSYNADLQSNQVESLSYSHTSSHHHTSSSYTLTTRNTKSLTGYGQTTSCN